MAMMARMHILLTNDDGIDAPGLHCLADALSPRHDLTVVAPDREQSGVSHALTLHRGMTPRETSRNGSPFGLAVDGFPADCAKLALDTLLEEPPDLVISGINHGFNAGVAVLYSGTLAGATEGAIQHVPSIALSVAWSPDPRWDTAARVARELVDRFGQADLPRHVLLNVNVPGRAYEELAGYAAAAITPSRYENEFYRRESEAGEVSYHIHGEITVDGNYPDGDLARLRNGYVTISPIHFDLTAYDHLNDTQRFAADLNAQAT